MTIFQIGPWTSYRRRSQLSIERNQLGVERTREPKVARIISGKTCRFSKVYDRRVVNGDGFHLQPVRKAKGGANGVPVTWLPSHLCQAYVGEFKIQQRRRSQSRAFQSLGDMSRL